MADFTVFKYINSDIMKLLSDLVFYNLIQPYIGFINDFVQRSYI